MGIVLEYLIITTLISLIAFFINYKKKRRHMEELASQLPGPRCLPIVGNLFYFMGTTHTEFIERIGEIGNAYRQQKPFRLWLGNELVIGINEPKDFEVLFSNAKIIDKGPLFSFFQERSAGAFTTSGEIWRKYRRVAIKMFHSNLMEKYVDVFNEQGKKLTNYLSQKSPQETFNVAVPLMRCTLDSICRTAFGTHMELQSNPDVTFPDDLTIFLEVEPPTLTQEIPIRRVFIDETKDNVMTSCTAFGTHMELQSNPDVTFPDDLTIRSFNSCHPDSLRLNHRPSLRKLLEEAEGEEDEDVQLQPPTPSPAEDNMNNAAVVASLQPEKQASAAQVPTISKPLPKGDLDLIPDYDGNPIELISFLEVVETLLTGYCTSDIKTHFQPDLTYGIKTHFQPDLTYGIVSESPNKNFKPIAESILYSLIEKLKEVIKKRRTENLKRSEMQDNEEDFEDNMKNPNLKLYIDYVIEASENKKGANDLECAKEALDVIIGVRKYTFSTHTHTLCPLAILVGTSKVEEPRNWASRLVTGSLTSGTGRFLWPRSVSRGRERCSQALLEVLLLFQLERARFQINFTNISPLMNNKFCTFWYLLILPNNIILEINDSFIESNIFKLTLIIILSLFTRYKWVIFIIMKLLVRFSIFPDDCTLPAGASLYLCYYNVHRDPRFWTHPNDFYPEHFLLENISKRPKYSYIPFSYGPRSCPGSKYGIMSIKIMMSHILRRFDVECDLKLDDMRFKPGLMLELEGGYPIRLIPRVHKIQQT
ncbi:uncharacterized protein LOC111058575 [Nilaparvata lugens]|uniref:uncharacterized protein LOC111058575 n=1 Tax=Nilaparvata lugens TaxID=108931 RepID=UPI00193DF692|nr:uncharacterized protein LOC111058575 [Nilaparvata lugens]